MALPKKKTAKERQGKRRAHQALRLPPIDYCPQCHSPKLAHHVCLTCGTYEGREVIEIKAKKKE
ncbi:MAG TPA: 50S ribosomal protein L32 [Dehalococcoidia bacterium]|nr:50S ribosomal protein L32 [Dehalococcoidia bacterium]